VRRDQPRASDDAGRGPLAEAGESRSTVAQRVGGEKRARYAKVWVNVDERKKK